MKSHIFSFSAVALLLGLSYSASGYAQPEDCNSVLFQGTCVPCRPGVQQSRDAPCQGCCWACYVACPQPAKAAELGQFKAGQFKACGSDASTKYTIDPEIVFFLIDLDANWELFDRLVEDHPAIAFTLAISSIALSRWTEDGALTNARDQRHHNGHLLSIPSPEYVRRFVSGEKLDLADAEQLNSPLPDGATSVYMESFFSHVPGGQGEIIARASIIRQSETDGENYEVIAILSQVRFRLALLEKDVFEVQHRSSAVTPRGQGSIYKLADMVDMTPTRRGFSGIEEEVEAC